MPAALDTGDDPASPAAPIEATGAAGTPPYGSARVMAPPDERGPVDRMPVRPRRRRRWPYVLVALVALPIGYYIVTLFQVWHTGRSDGARPAEAIVVLGAAQYDGRPSPQLAARLDHAAELWVRGVAPVVMVTGGKQPGDRFTEAEASRDYLIDLGVPGDAILLENEGRTTYGSLDAASGILAGVGVDEVLLVTDPYHALRSRLIAGEVGLDAAVSPTPTSVVTGSASLRRHLQEAGGVAVGRIVGFDRLTDLTG